MTTPPIFNPRSTDLYFDAQLFPFTPIASNSSAEIYLTPESSLFIIPPLIDHMDVPLALAIALVLVVVLDDWSDESHPSLAHASSSVLLTCFVICSRHTGHSHHLKKNTFWLDLCGHSQFAITPPPTR